MHPERKRNIGQIKKDQQRLAFRSRVSELTPWLEVAAAAATSSCHHLLHWNKPGQKISSRSRSVNVHGWTWLESEGERRRELLAYRREGDGQEEEERQEEEGDLGHRRCLLLSLFSLPGLQQCVDCGLEILWLDRLRYM
jgi:hypothetical protein